MGSAESVTGPSKSCTSDSDNGCGQRLLQNVPLTKQPIVYSKDYNITCGGIEKLHVFDSCKWGNIHQYLLDHKLVTKESTVSPTEAMTDDLLLVHTQEYIKSLKWSSKVAAVTEVFVVAVIPNFIVQRALLKPLRLQTGGTVLAAKLALERGWAVNIGGGFHHCHGKDGGGFCVYADITLAIKCAFLYCNVKTVMIVDLDAHQGNGHERDFMNDDNVYIMDVFNGGIYPGDMYAKGAIKKMVELQSFTKDSTYLQLVESNLKEALDEFTPELLVYNAGTDILQGDPLGLLDITREGIIRRDEIVFASARSKEIPIIMVTSGGYQRITARVIADSIINLSRKGLLEDRRVSQI